MATPPPSQFAALLRRSKFASFDPQITQVYTAYDGYAARGNFGLKRPLALRRRNAHITVQAVDSREQQTVWRSAEQENRFIRMADEVGVTPKLKLASSWGWRVGSVGLEASFAVDSEFAPAPDATKKTVEPNAEGEENAEDVGKKSTVLGRPQSENLPNPEAMSIREYEKYLERMRQLRPAFRKFLIEKYGSTGAFELSVRANEDYREFLKMHAYQQYHAPRPRVIEQQPHRFAGLTYTAPSYLQTTFTTKPQVGRRVGSTQTRQAGDVVAFAGVAATMSKGQRGDDDSEVTTYRFNEIHLRRPPATVGSHPSGLESAYMVAHVRVDSDKTTEGHRRANEHVPGTKEYVAHVQSIPIPVHRDILKPVSAIEIRTRPSATRTDFAQKMVASLISMHQR